MIGLPFLEKTIWATYNNLWGYCSAREILEGTDPKEEIQKKDLVNVYLIFIFDF